MNREFIFFICLSIILGTSNVIAQENTMPIAENPTDKSGKISMDFKGMDIVEAIKALSTRAGVNVVIGKNVSGKVTLFLKDVNVWDAFEILLLANDLAYEKKGNIVSIMPQHDYEERHGERYMDNKIMKTVNLKYAKAAEASKVLNQIKTNLGRIIVDEGSNSLILMDSKAKMRDMLDILNKMDIRTETRIYDLKYAQAGALAEVLENEITKVTGFITVDERTNKIIITDYPQIIERISELVKAFDERSPQVLIDAQVIEIRPSSKFEMGVDWDYWIEKNVRIASALPSTNPLSKISIGTAAAGNNVSGPGEYKGIIDLLRTIGETKILSSPRITVLNNQEAKILVGTKDAYITSTVSQSGTGTAITSQSVNFVDVGIKLFVTPTINKDKFITMKIKPEISSSERRRILSNDTETEIPIVTTSEAETSVTIKDGITIIIGGLRKDEHIKNIKKIPVLGDIPFIGFFFRNIFDEVRNTELVILLTPHLMSGEETYTEFSTKAPEKGVVATMSEGEIILENYPIPASIVEKSQ